MIRGVTVIGCAVVVGFYSASLLAEPLPPLAIFQSLTLLLIAFATYSWAIMSTGVAATLTLAAVVVTLWACARLQAPLLGLDVVGLAVLAGMASWYQRRRARRLQRLEQTLSDFSEELYLKDQSLSLTEQAHASLTRKAARYQQLQTVAERLSRVAQLEAIAQLAVDHAFELIGKSDACLLFLVDKARQDLSLYTSRRAPEVPVIRTKQGDQFDHYALRTQRPLMVNDVRRDFRFSVGESADRRIGSVIACPLVVADSAEGVLRLDSAQPGMYSQEDLRFLDILLGLINTAVGNARLFAQTQQLALTDGLTGLYRRQPLLDQLTREVARATRTREPLSVLMLDLDYFKRYNDTHGHPAGDLVLKMVADVMRASVPPDATCGRYGGEEFSVLIPRASRELGREVAERIRATVEANARAAGQSPRGIVTVSIGVSVFPEDTPSELELIRVADQRLYQAKRTGRNRVVT